MGWSDKPGVCETDGCPKEGQPLEDCDCVDGGHYDRLLEDTSTDDVEETEE